MPDLSPAAQAALNATKVKFYESPPTGAELAAWILRALTHKLRGYVLFLHAGVVRSTHYSSHQ